LTAHCADRPWRLAREVAGPQIGHPHLRINIRVRCNEMRSALT
jgi:hypothetical protein